MNPSKVEGTKSSFSVFVGAGVVVGTERDVDHGSEVEDEDAEDGKTGADVEDGAGGITVAGAEDGATVAGTEHGVTVADAEDGTTVAAPSVAMTRTKNQHRVMDRGEGGAEVSQHVRWRGGGEEGAESHLRHRFIARGDRSWMLLSFIGLKSIRSTTWPFIWSNAPIRPGHGNTSLGTVQPRWVGVGRRWCLLRG